MRRWVARGDPAPAVRRWLAQVSRALPPCRQCSEGTLAAVACALYALEGPAPHLLRLEDILMGCFLHWTDMGANPRWGLPTLQCVPQGLAVSGPALQGALGWRYGQAAPLWRSPRLRWREGTQLSQVAPLLAPLGDQGPVGDTHPMAPGAPCLVVPPLDQEYPALGAAIQGRRAAAPVRRVVRGAASPGGATAAPAAPVLPRGGRRPRSGVARGPRARGGVAAAPRGAGRVPRALT